MLTTPIDGIPGIVAAARASFVAGTTQPLKWRLELLDRVAGQLRRDEERLLDALAADLGKPRPEAWFTEIGFTLAEIEHTVANLAMWVRPDRVATPLPLQPGSSRIVREPLGVVTIIAPWNYPVQLTLGPLIGALAAGNAVVVKPSELAPNAATAIGELLTGLAEPAVQVVQGGVQQTTALLAERVDHILYTGNGRVGRIVARAAAEHLTPVTLELGGKTPSVVSRHADILVSARRIAWGRFVNAGQTCIAPDYVLVERPVHDAFVEGLGEAIREFYGVDPQTSADFGRIVNDVHFHRLEKLLGCGKVAFGGQSDADTRYVAPTVLTDVEPGEAVMAEEIFGPILPVIAVDSLDEAVAMINAGDKPLALYSFSQRDEDNERVLAGTSSGGACVNGTLLHIGNPHLPFGGVGESGHGAYHGRFGFETFSHRRAVFQRSTRLDPPIAYPPYTGKKSSMLRRGLGLGDPRDAWARLRGRWMTRNDD